MAAKARLETRSTLNDSEFQAGVQRMRKHARSLSGELKHLFRRDPELKAEHALTGLIEDLTRGDIPAAIEHITSRMGGLGIAAGVGIGAAVIAVNELHKKLGEVSVANQSAIDALDRPLSAQSALGPQGIAAEVAKSEKALEDLSTTSVRVLDAFVNQQFKIRERRSTGTPFEMPFELRREGPQTQIEREREQLVEREVKLQQALLDSQDALTKSKLEAIEGSSLQADLDKIAADAAERRAKAELAASDQIEQIGKKRKDLGMLKADELIEATLRAQSGIQVDITKEEEAAAKAAKEKAADKSREVEAEMQLADMTQRGASADQMRLAGLQSHLRLLQDQLRINQQLTQEQKAQLNLEIEQAKAQLQQEQSAQRRAQLEKVQLTLEDLAKFGRGGTEGPRATPGFSSDHPFGFGAGTAAREAMAEMQAARDAMLREDIPGALKHGARAEEIKASIPELKESQKDPSLAVREGNDATQIFHDILDAIKTGNYSITF